MDKNITVKEGVSQQLLFPLELHFYKQEIKLIQQFKVKQG